MALNTKIASKHLYAKAQLQLIFIQVLIQAEGWDKDPDWLNRGKDGRFGGGTTEDKKKIIFDKTVEAVVGVTKNTIKLSLSDSGFRERAGLSAEMGMAKMIKATSKAIGKNPELEQKIDNLIQKTADKLAETYGDDKDPLAQAIRKSDGIVASADSSVVEKMEFAAAKYQIYMEALTNPEKYEYTPKQQQELVGYSVAASIQLAVNLACNISLSIGLGLLFRESMSRAVSSALLGEVFNQAAIVGLEKADIDDPWIGFGVFLAAGALSDGILSLAAKKIPGLASKVAIAEGLKKEVAEIAKKEATEIAKKEATETAEKAATEIAKKEAAEIDRIGSEKAAELAKKGAKKVKPILITNLEDIINTKSSSSSMDWLVNTVNFDVGSHKVEMLIDNFNYKGKGGRLFSEVSFKVNNSFEKQEMASDESRAIVYQLRKLFKQKVKDTEEGRIFRCEAHYKDGFGEQRKNFYKSMGFAEQHDGTLAGTVKDGKIVSILLDVDD